MNTFVIAEAGANHNQDFNQALSLIDIAKESGASAVKFQTYSSESLYAKNTPDFAGYKNINKLIKDIELPREWQKDLKLYCDDKGIEFMSTPFDEKAVEELVDIGVSRLKIAGFESTDWRFVEMVASAGLPLIISAGIGFREQHFHTLFSITDKHKNDTTILHCNNAYPTPMEDAGVHLVKHYVARFGGRYKVGLSDHTESALTPALAVAAGASTIEKHFTLSRRLPGPDHPFALEPGELSEAISLISEAEVACQPISADISYSQSELPMKQARRSVVALTPLAPGDVLSKTNITTKRPYIEGDISASDYFKVLGATTQRPIKADSALSASDILWPKEAHQQCADMWSGG